MAAPNNLYSVFLKFHSLCFAFILLQKFNTIYHYKETNLQEIKFVKKKRKYVHYLKYVTHFMYRNIVLKSFYILFLF